MTPANACPVTNFDTPTFGGYIDDNVKTPDMIDELHQPNMAMDIMVNMVNVLIDNSLGEGSRTSRDVTKNKSVVVRSGHNIAFLSLFR